MTPEGKNFRDKPAWKLILVLTLIALLTWLYFRSADVVPGSHVNYTRKLRELQLFDEQLNSGVVASFAGLIENYDSQRFYLAQIDKTLLELRNIPRWVEPADRKTIANALINLSDIHQQKALDVDRFQRIHAVVRNSSLYLPIAADASLAQLSSTEQHDFKDFVRRLISYTLTRQKNTQERQYLAEQIKTLTLRHNTQPLATALQHAEIVLNSTPKTLKLVNSITRSDSMTQLEDTSRLYLAAYRKAVTEATYYQTLLYALSLLLVGYALYALFRIGRDRRSLIVAHLDLENRFQAQRRAEEELRLYATVFTNASEGMTITDATTKIIAVNPAFCQITGYSKEGIIGKTPKILNSGRQNDAFYQNMWNTLNSQGQWKGEIWNSRKDGSTFPEWLSITAITDQNNQPSHYIGVFTDITERKQNEARIHHLAHHDALTGLPNRLLLSERIQHGIQTSPSSHLKTAVIFIDLDRFKNINDTLGHSVGDDLLIQVAHRGLSVLRETDTFCRQGGDEFVAVLTGLSSRQEAGHICDELLNTLCQPYLLAGHELTVSGSAGIAVYPEDGDNATELLRKADLAMYRAKEIGRNTFCYFSAEISTTSIGELLLENDLFTALERNELLLHYQAKVNSRTGELIGAEALMRWNHKTHGLISPQIFIPLAEESGLINAMGEWAIRTVCAQLRSWIDEGLQVLPIAVNISAHQFVQQALPQLLADILAEFAVPAQLIELELTESMLMGNASHAASTLHQLKDMGIEVSIDDFGTGYSSLSYLHQFPVHALKIDRSFISQINENGEPIRLASAIIAMAHELGLQVIAEGVETEVQARYLVEHGCDISQGFLYSKPLAAADFVHLLKNSG